MKIQEINEKIDFLNAKIPKIDKKIKNSQDKLLIISQKRLIAKKEELKNLEEIENTYINNLKKYEELKKKYDNLIYELKQRKILINIDKNEKPHIDTLKKDKDIKRKSEPLKYKNNDKPKNKNNKFESKSKKLKEKEIFSLERKIQLIEKEMLEYKRRQAAWEREPDSIIMNQYKMKIKMYEFRIQSLQKMDIDVNVLRRTRGSFLKELIEKNRKHNDNLEKNDSEKTVIIYDKKSSSEGRDRCLICGGRLIKLKNGGYRCENSPNCSGLTRSKF
ncbi:MAG: hypothetical protein FWH54_02670 [Methanobrevibacter sp.]|nr:hypothetical protein [Methanobrevibacter sp.]